ncbi:MAG: hypothetical protein WC838_07185 [Candidatus Margulisiibacteriota bacterium]|jgi:hypothetical protein
MQRKIILDREDKDSTVNVETESSTFSILEQYGTEEDRKNNADMDPQRGYMTRFRDAVIKFLVGK